MHKIEKKEMIQNSLKINKKNEVFKISMSFERYLSGQAFCYNLLFKKNKRIFTTILNANTFSISTFVLKFPIKNQTTKFKIQQ